MGISQESLDKAKALMDDQELHRAISVNELMKNGSEIYDVEQAIVPFCGFVDRMYPKQPQNQ